ncbi:MAG: HAMP domain-containing sensor histidine kinase [Clostridia bacterium]|nr:HAMP domain-containing sensor histidine kinase [Clostridia bacterium]
MFKSIFRRLIWTYSIIFLLVFIVMFTAMSGFYLNYIGTVKYDSAEKAASAIERMTTVLATDYQTQEAWDFYNTSLYSWSHIVGSDITVIDSKGDVFASTADIKIAPDKLTKEVLDGKTFRRYTKFGSYYDGVVHVVGIPLKFHGEIVGGLFFNTTSEMITGLLVSFFRIFLFSFLISVFFALVMIFFQAKKISKPISNINSAVLSIASGNFDKRLPVNSKDETGQLSSSFNYMAESLKQLDKMRESFISDVSHELRTPMTSITGFVGGILDGTIPEEKHEEYLRLVYEESKRLSRMTSDMLEMSKMTSSEYKLSMQKFDICEVVRLAIISLESKIDKKNLELEVNFAKDQIFVMADKDSILRVVINLLDNAIKFSFENTKITIAVLASSDCCVRIGNFGIGIDQKDLEHIFDRFYKTDKSRGKDKTGAGLGLSMARNIMNLHRSTIWAESINAKEGSDVKYTTFTFKLELA